MTRKDINKMLRHAIPEADELRWKDGDEVEMCIVYSKPVSGKRAYTLVAFHQDQPRSDADLVKVKVAIAARRLDEILKAGFPA